jgi:hypothetical protein
MHTQHEFSLPPAPSHNHTHTRIKHTFTHTRNRHSHTFSHHTSEPQADVANGSHARQHEGVAATNSFPQRSVYFLHPHFVVIPVLLPSFRHAFRRTRRRRTYASTHTHSTWDEKRCTHAPPQGQAAKADIEVPTQPQPQLPAPSSSRPQAHYMPPQNQSAKIESQTRGDCLLLPLSRPHMRCAGPPAPTFRS